MTAPDRPLPLLRNSGHSHTNWNPGVDLVLDLTMQIIVLGHDHADRAGRAPPRAVPFAAQPLRISWPITSYHLELISLQFFDLRPLSSVLGRVGWIQVAQSDKKIVASKWHPGFHPPCLHCRQRRRRVAFRGRSRASKVAFTAGHCRGAGRCGIHQDHHQAAESVVGVTLHAPP